MLDLGISAGDVHKFVFDRLAALGERVVDLKIVDIELNPFNNSDNNSVSI